MVNNKYHRNKLIILMQKGFAFEPIKNKGYHIDESYTTPKILTRIIRRIWMFLNISKQEIWYGKWKKNLYIYDTVILFDSLVNQNMIEFINRKFPETRIILWHWNPIKNKRRDIKGVGSNFEEWSFDESDCNHYGLKYNSTFFLFDEYENDNNNKNIDVYFAGLDKGRLDYLLHLEKEFNNRGITTRFDIVNEKRVNKKKYNYKKRMPYLEILKSVERCSIILDIVQEGQCGATQREMESLFLNKKLITNNKGIVDRDYYNGNNIFILGVDSMDRLEDFMKNNFEIIDEKIKSKYTFESWLNNFFIKNV